MDHAWSMRILDAVAVGKAGYVDAVDRICVKNTEALPITMDGAYPVLADPRRHCQ
jgi:hypothetical protein